MLAYIKYDQNSCVVHHMVTLDGISNGSTFGDLNNKVQEGHYV